MIEVEKKFFLDNADRNALLLGAKSVGTKTFTDTYYDTSAYDLTRRDIWLRVRDDRWELKLPLGHFQSRAANQYRELETEKEISEYFHFTGEQPLSDSLANAGYLPFATITTVRSKYERDGFIIDLDVMDFGYELAEIEKMVENEEEAEKAAEEILEFARTFNLRPGQVRGKVIEFLKRKDPNHFNALVSAGIVLPDGSR